MTSAEKAVVLLSGGIDSLVTLAVAREEGFTAIHALSFRYGQRHEVEVEAARRIAERFGVTSRQVVDLDLASFGGSALTDAVGRGIDVDRTPEEMASGIPSTYVPARNTVFLSIAVALAESLGVSHIFIAVNALDYSGYPDCRPDYLEAFQRAVNLGTRAGTCGQPFTIHAPLVAMDKTEIIRRGAGLGVDFGLSVSCYLADYRGRACGRCDACTLRRQGFLSAGVADPTIYQNAGVAR